MKKITLIVAVLINFITLAQPVLNVSDINPLSQSAYLHSASSATLGVGSSGANQIWNFSSLTLNVIGLETANTVSSAPYASSFPTANYFIRVDQGDSFGYFNLTSNKLESVGNSDSATIFQSFVNPRTVFIFPLNFNNTYTDTYQVATSTTVNTKVSTYDAYGTVITAFGTYNNVIRLKEVTGLSTVYNYFTVNPYKDILQARSSGGTTINYTVYEPTNLSTTQNEVKQFAVHPNPTSGNISIKNIDFSNKSMFVKVYNILGNQIINNYKLETESANIDLSNYATGLYFIEIADENNKVLYQDKIIKK